MRKDLCKFLVGHPTAPALLEGLASDVDSEVRKAAVEAMGWSEGVSLERFLQDSDPDTLITALDAIRRRGRGEASQVAPLLDHGDAEVRLRAAEALSALAIAGDVPGPIAARIRDLLFDPDERIQAAVAAVYPDALPVGASILVRRAAAAAGGPVADADDALVRWARPNAEPAAIAYARGVVVREDELVHLRFSWNRPEDQPPSHRTLRPPMIREYGHPNRG